MTSDHNICQRSMPLRNKTALVTGGSRGIGRAIVRMLLENGADCAFTYSRDRTAADALAEEAAHSGRTAVPFQMDVRDLEGTKALIEDVKKRFGRLDILINNAGITRDKALMSMTAEDWSDVIDTNLTGVFNATRAAIITFLKQKSGAIVNISSVSGVHPLPGQVNYAAAKAGVIGFTKSLAKEVAPYNIRVNAVAPGFIETEMTSELSDRLRDRFLSSVPLGRFGTADEVAHAVLFLVRDDAHYITGQTIQVDGGLGI